MSPTSRLLPLASALVLLLLPGVLPAAEDELDMQPLYDAVYIDARDVTADVPCGSFSLNDGLVCFLPGGELRKEGMFIGSLELSLNRLPHGEGVLNRFYEAEVQRTGREPHSLEFKVASAYLNASLSSDSTVQAGGRAVSIREWEQLDKDEQEQFTALYREGRSRSWVDGELARPREPRGREFYANFHTRVGKDEAERHLLMYVTSDGSELRIEDADSHEDWVKAELPQR